MIIYDDHHYTTGVATMLMLLFSPTRTEPEAYNPTKGVNDCNSGSIVRESA